MKILGLHANTHDSGCALIDNGRLVYAANQERFDRVKMSKASPVEAVEALLRTTGVAPEEIDYLAVSDDIGAEGYRSARKRFTRITLDTTFRAARSYYARRPWSLLKYWRHFRFRGKKKSARRHDERVRRPKAYLADRGFGGEVRSYEHGFCHAATAYYPSGFEECLLFVMEGASFINASSVYLGRDEKIEKLLDIPWPHSPGVFYATVTLLLGFTPTRHEGKITGLAAQGDPTVLGDLARSLFRLHPEKDGFRISPLIHIWYWDYQAKRRPDALPKELRGHRREDIAAAWQIALEEAVVGLVERYLKRYPHVRHVGLAGGVHGNVKLNQRINALDPIEEIYVHPGMSDCGQAAGAALACWAEVAGDSPPSRLQNVYLGPPPDPREIDNLADKLQLVFEPTDRLPDRIAELLTQGKVVALCRGAMEYGPRALGNRSILYTPTDPAVNDWLNKQLRRTEFMPFAPVTLIEEAPKCYVNGLKSAHTSSFMTVCYDCTDYMARTQPAVVHVDGTARPQYISREQNPFYYDIVSCFRDRTGLPSVVNTSFNMPEEPIVCTAEDALEAFVASHLDALVLADRLLLRESNPQLPQKLAEHLARPQAS